MSRDICIFQSFLTPAHKAQITAAAEAAVMTPYFFTKDQFNAARDCVQHCEVLYAASPDLLRTAPATLKWYCASSAGVDAYCRDESLFANPNCLLSNSNAYGVTIAEHTIMVTLMLLRQMPTVQEWMHRHDWSDEKPPMRSVCGSRITVLGTGDIGTSFARRVKAMGAKTVVGVSRSGRHVDDAYDAMYTTAQLDQVLPETEILAMALPGTAETEGILSRSRIALLPKEAVVVNVGRGTAIDQDALMEALNAGRLAGAALDVVRPEPLPPEHPLWNTKNLLLTPHLSGFMSLGITRDTAVALFCEDFENYIAGRPLKRLVDRRKGY